MTKISQRRYDNITLTKGEELAWLNMEIDDLTKAYESLSKEPCDKVRDIAKYELRNWKRRKQKHKEKIKELKAIVKQMRAGQRK